MAVIVHGSGGGKDRLNKDVMFFDVDETKIKKSDVANLWFLGNNPEKTIYYFYGYKTIYYYSKDGRKIKTFNNNNINIDFKNFGLVDDKIYYFNMSDRKTYVLDLLHSELHQQDYISHESIKISDITYVNFLKNNENKLILICEGKSMQLSNGQKSVFLVRYDIQNNNNKRYINLGNGNVYANVANNRTLLANDDFVFIKSGLYNIKIGNNGIVYKRYFNQDINTDYVVGNAGNKAYIMVMNVPIYPTLYIINLIDGSMIGNVMGLNDIWLEENTISGNKVIYKFLHNKANKAYFLLSLNNTPIVVVMNSDNDSIEYQQAVLNTNRIPFFKQNNRYPDIIKDYAVYIDSTNNQQRNDEYVFAKLEFPKK